jgi:hypothetical protein
VLHAGIEIDLIGKQHWPISAQTAKERRNGNGRASTTQSNYDRVTTPKGCTIAGFKRWKMYFRV